jgi:quinol monooxygenase YgiN
MDGAVRVRLEGLYKEASMGLRLALSLGFLAAFAAAGPLDSGAQAQQTALDAPANPSPLYVETFIDLMPQNTAPGTVAIKQYVRDTRKDAGIVRCEAIAQIAGRANHLIVLEVWRDEGAYEAHESAQHTRDYRALLQPLLGAPFDQRVHFVVE